MKEFFKAYKFYMKMVYPPLMLVLTFLVMSVGIIIIIVTDLPETKKSFFSTLNECSMFHIGIMFNCIYTELLKQFKFFKTTKFAKVYYTVIPVFAMAVIGVIYDVILFFAAAVFMDFNFASDLIIYNSVATIATVLLGSASNIPKLSTFAWLFWATYCLFFPLFHWAMPQMTTFGLPIYADILIAIAIYAMGFTVNVALLNHWWTKTERNMSKSAVWQTQ